MTKHPEAAVADIKQNEVDEEKELATFQPSWSHRRWLHLIALYFLFVLVVFGLPLWCMTTSTHQEALPCDEIKSLSQEPIHIDVDVVLLNANPQFNQQDMVDLRDLLHKQTFDAGRNLEIHHRSQRLGSLADLPVQVNFRFYARQLVIDDALKLSKMGLSADFEAAVLKAEARGRVSEGSQPVYNPENAYFFVVIPMTLSDLGTYKNDAEKDVSAIVRNSPERNLVYLSTPHLPPHSGVQKISTTIFTLLEDHLVSPGKLQATYQSVWRKGGDMVDSGGPNTYTDIASQLAETRTRQLPPSPGYEVTVTLVSAFSEGNLPPTDNWMSTSTSPMSSEGLSFGDWLEEEVDPGLDDFKQFLNLNVYSQYLYSVSLEDIIRSRISKDRTHRYYSTTQLSSLLNSLEAYLGQHSSRRGWAHVDVDGGRTNGTNGGLHFVIVVDTHTRTFNATTRKPIRFRLPDGAMTSIAVVPQWGAFISLDDVDVGLSNLGTVLVRAIRSFIGLPGKGSVIYVPGGGRVFFEHSSVHGGAAKWEIDAWLRSRIVESLSTVSLTLNSFVSTKERVPNMVINLDVSRRVHDAVHAWQASLLALISFSRDAVLDQENVNPLKRAFVLARIALENADAAFFANSLLDLLYFPSDQIYGIYVPLFGPTSFSIVITALGAIKFLKIGRLTPRK